MRIGGRFAGGLVLGLLTLATSSGIAGAASTEPYRAPNTVPIVVGTSRDVCSAAVQVGQAMCLAQRRTDRAATTVAPTPLGDAAPGVTSSATLGNAGAYDPSYLQSAYNAPSSSNGSGQTVAIVDAYDDPNAASDLTNYRSYFGLPACTTASGCFRKVNETGGTAPPGTDAGWSQEISLDLDMVSAICPNCRILLVEASSSSFSDLGTSVNEAVKLGANVVSNSYGGNEFSGESSVNSSYFNHPGVAITVAAGDDGYGAEYPASSNTVTAVGGTTLQQATNTGTRNATETVWTGSGSGCSAYESKPTWQTDSSCSKRMVNDVSAIGDPNTGVWVYDSYATGSSGSWGVFGGTSVATPIVGAMYALAGNASSTTAMNSLPYKDSAGLNDVTSGSNGTCSTTYYCNGEVGYDGPTGLGTPNGIGAFSVNGASSSTAPGAPTGLSATAGSSVVNLSWTAPSSNGGSAITSYKIYRGTATGGETLLTTSGTGTTYADTPVTNGTKYFYEVTANNVVGESGRSNESSATPTSATTVPGAPTGLSATAGSSVVNLSWTAPSSNGGSAITSYKIYRGTATGGETLLTTSGTGTTYADTPVTNGTKYFYEVTANNVVGESGRSNESSATPTSATTVPGAPTGLSATAGSSVVNLSWTAPSSNGGSSITSYKIYRGASTGNETLLTTSGTGTTYADTSAINGTKYFYEVTANNVVGESGRSNESSATPVAAATAPAAPTNLVTSGGTSVVNLSWTAPSNNGGSSITGYNIYRSTSSGNETLLTSVGTGTTYSDTNIVDGTPYFYEVAAVNGVGTGGKSNQSSATPTAPSSGLSAPQNLIMRSTRPFIVMSWTAPANNGGSAITGYAIYRGTSSGNETLLETVGTGTSFQDRTAPAGSIFYYRVAAINASGIGPLSNEVKS